jgi:hypothetical protein
MQHRQPKPEDLAREPKPMVVTLDAQEIGALYAARATPWDFNQNLLSKFKAAGAPVEGVLELKLAHGQVYKMKDDLLQRPGIFTYAWLSEGYCAALDEAGGVA